MRTIAPAIVYASPGRRVLSNEAGFIIRKRSGLLGLVELMGTAATATTSFVAARSVGLDIYLSIVAAFLAASATLPLLAHTFEWAQTIRFKPKPDYIAGDFVAFKDANLLAGTRLARQTIDQMAGTATIGVIAARHDPRLRTLYRRLGGEELRTRQFIFRVDPPEPSVIDLTKAIERAHT